MDFLGIGGWEVLLILVIALMIWGPARLAEIGKTLGKMVRALRKATSDLSAQVSREIEEEKREQPPGQHGGD
ncbi:Sec-independent protein translocase protein TatA [subsurface metagenome]|nr:MAG: twin-arginine translocase TatA/TatE family subunit [Dehalococcoidia bacterium]